MKGLLEMSLGTLTVIILGLIVLIILLGVYRIMTDPNTGIPSFTCAICNTLVGNLLNGVGMSFLNPCTNIFNCNVTSSVVGGATTTTYSNLIG